MKDKKLILNIWATWCKPCIDEMPSLEKLSRKLPNDYIVLLASNEEKGKIRRFQERYPFDLEFVRLKEDPQNLGIDLFPTTFIFDKKGEVVEIHKGVRDWNMMELP